MRDPAGAPQFTPSHVIRQLGQVIDLDFAPRRGLQRLVNHPGRFELRNRRIFSVDYGDRSVEVEVERAFAVHDRLVAARFVHLRLSFEPALSPGVAKQVVAAVETNIVVVRVPDAPGLGVEPDMAVVEKFLVRG